MRLHCHIAIIRLFATLCGGAVLGIALQACYKPPKLAPNALSVQIYRGKSSLKDCIYITESTGVVNTKGYGVKLLDAISGAENDLRNKAIKYGGNAVLVLHTESRYLSADYEFNIGVAKNNVPHKIDEYVMYGEIYRCRF